VVLVLTAGPTSPAHAERFSIGASVGSSKGEGGTDPMSTRGVFARLEVSRRLSIEAGVGAIQVAHSSNEPVTGSICTPERCDDGSTYPSFSADRAKTASAALRLDLTERGTVVPHVLIGAGVESWKSDYTEWVYSRREVGAGLDVQITGGLRIGGDIRIGSRELAGQRQLDDLVIQVYIPPPLPEEPTSYVATRVTLSAGF
jgi:hypothetical protein